MRRTELQLPEGGNLLDMLVAANLPESQHDMLVISVGGKPVDRLYWGRLRPKANSLVTVGVRLHGGDGGGAKDVLRVVALIAVTVFAPQLSAIIAPGLVGTTAGAILTAGIAVAGQLIVNAVFPPPRTNALSSAGSATPESPQYSIEGTQNQVRPWGLIPTALGQTRVVPPKLIVPYTENEGDLQYVYEMFAIGLGPTWFHDLKFGDTSLFNYTDVELEWLNAVQEELNETPLNGVSDFVTSIISEDTPNLPLTPITGSNAIGWQTATTPIDTDEMIIDIAFPQGFVYIDNNGNRQSISRTFHVRYRDADGDGTYLAATDTALSVAEQSYTPPQGQSQIVYIPFGQYTRPAQPTSGLLYIDQSSGALGVVQNRTVQTNPFIPVTQTSAELPRNKIEICRWSRAGDGTTTITDTRTTSSSAGIYNSYVVSGFDPSVDGSNNIVVAAGELLREFIISGATEQVLRKSYHFTFPYRGQWEVLVRQFTANETSLQVRDDGVWTKLRSIKNEEPFNQDNMAALAMRIRATNQLNGVISNFNCIATGMAPWFSGGDTGVWYAEQATKNPAALVIHVLTGPSNPRRLRGAYQEQLADGGDTYSQANVVLDLNESFGEFEDIDMASFQDWFDFCETGNNDTNNPIGFEFNQYVDYSTSVDELVDLIASAGRARILRINGKRVAIFDGAKDEDNDIVEHLNQQNCRNFRSTKVFTDELHAWRIRFPNEEKDFLQDEMFVYADGYSVDGSEAGTVAADPRYIETLELPGITNPDLIYLQGRYYHAVRIHRPEIYQVDMDQEYLNVRPGDLVKLTYDVPLFGLGSFRVIGIGTSGSDQVSIDINGIATMEAAESYVVRIRLSNGNSILKSVDTVAGENTTLTFTVAEAAGISLENLVMFGLNGSESASMLVKDIITKADLTATVELVDYGPAIQGNLSETIPAFDSQITVVENLEVPVIAQVPIQVDPDNDPNEVELEQVVYSDERAMYRGEDGSFEPGIYIKLDPTVNRPIWRIDALLVSLKNAGDDDPFKEVMTLRGDVSDFTIEGVDEFNTYDVRLQYRFRDGQVGESTIVSTTVTGKTNNPDPPDTVSITEYADGTRKYDITSRDPDPDLWGFRIYARQLLTGEVCDDLTFPDDFQDLYTIPVQSVAGQDARGILENNDLPDGEFCFAVVAEDTGGRQSETVRQTISFADPRLGNAVFSRNVGFNNWAYGGSENLFANSGSQDEIYTSLDGWGIVSPAFVAPESIEDPFGGQKAYQMTMVNAGSFHVLLCAASSSVARQPFDAIAANTDYTMSVWVRNNATEIISFGIGANILGFTHGAYFNLTTGAITDIQDNSGADTVTATMSPGPKGWTRIEVTFNIVSPVANYFGLIGATDTSGTILSDVNAGVVAYDVFGFQIQQSDEPGVFIETTGDPYPAEPGASTTNATIDSNNRIVPVDDTTYTSLGTWGDETTIWRDSPAASMIFEDAVIDISQEVSNAYLPFAQITSFGDSTLIEFRYGTSEANCLTASYADISTINTALAITNTHIQYRVTVTNPDVDGIFSLLEFLTE